MSSRGKMPPGCSARLVGPTPPTPAPQLANPLGTSAKVAPLIIPPRLPTRLPGWACRIRTKKSVREPPNWICVTISPKVGASLRQRPVAYELRYTDLLRPIQQAILARRAALYFPLPLPAGDPQFFSVSRRRLKNSPSTPLFVRRFTARKPSCGTLGACCTIQPQILTLF